MINKELQDLLKKYSDDIIIQVKDGEGVDRDIIDFYYTESFLANTKKYIILGIENDL